MLSKRLHQLFFASTSPAQVRVWFSLSLTFAVLYGILGLQQALGSDYAVQDDARQHVFWMRRFLDPQLFPQDLIADYFQSVAPWGYSHFYRLFTLLGIDPLLLSKLLPMGLGLITTAYSFGVSLQLLPIPFTGFLAALLTNQLLWSHDDLASATPRAFMLPLFLAFIYYLLRGKRLACLVTIALEGLFYPQYIFVFAGILLLQPWYWQQGRLRRVRQKSEYRFWAVALGVAALVLLFYALAPSHFGPVITAAQAKQLPEFFGGGRSQFFSSNPGTFWFSSNRSGMFPAFRPLLISIGLLLPLLLRAPARLPLARQVTPKVIVLVQMTLVALFLFFAAHALLFKLHLPSRYSSYTLRFVLVFATAISLTLLLEAGLRWLGQPKTSYQQILGWGVMVSLVLALLLYPSYASKFPKTNYQTGTTPKLYQFFAQQPKDSLIASLLKEADFFPTFSQRSLFVGREYAIPYHTGYAKPFRQRAIDLIRAQYSRNPATVIQFIRTSGVDFWVLSRNSFRRSFLKETWIKQYPDAVRQATRSLNQGAPLLAELKSQCAVIEEADFYVLPTSCVLQAAEARSQPQ